MSYKLNANVGCRRHENRVQEPFREQNAPEVKDPLPFLLELLSQFPKALSTTNPSIDCVLTLPSPFKARTASTVDKAECSQAFILVWDH